MEHDVVSQVAALMGQGHGERFIARTLGITRHKARTTMAALKHGEESASNGVSVQSESQNLEVSGTVRATSRSQSLAALLVDAEVDLNVWRVKRWIANMWGKPDNPMWQVKAWLERITEEERTLEELIARLEDKSPVVAETFRPIYSKKQKLALEISIADPHFGLRAFRGPSGADYNFETAARLYKTSIELLLERAGNLGLIEQICFVTGNDFIHADNVFHTTTAGTHQPEMDSWHETFMRAEELLISTILGLSRICPVHVVMVPGNHARQSEFAMGRILKAYFHKNDTVTVDAGPEPYKFWDYGCNLVGFDHGHSIKATRLASLMANERPQLWAHTWNREWHCADQHRETPMFSEFGVNIKYLPSMVTWNEWHKIKGFSWAHRASLGFLYDYERGLISTPQVNVREVYRD